MLSCSHPSPAPLGRGRGWGLMEFFGLLNLRHKPTVMQPHEILQASALDILFEHRNKAYGAYELRSHYPQRLWMAIAILPIVVFICFIKPSVDSKFQINCPISDTVEISPIHPPMVDPPPPPQAVQASPRAALGTSVPTEIVPDHLAPTPDVDLPMGGTPDGDPTLSPSEASVIPVAEGSAAAPLTTQPAPEPQANFTAVERMPQFPGGNSAWLQFLQRYLRAPAELEAGQKVQVLVRFTVGADGAVTDAVVIQSGGRAFDTEVIRVLKKMPRWEPALQNGQAIAVSFVQPVTFAGIEE